MALLLAAVAGTGAWAADAPAAKAAAPPHIAAPPQDPNAPDDCTWQGRALMCWSYEDGKWVAAEHEKTLRPDSAARAARGDTHGLRELAWFYLHGPLSRRDLVKGRALYARCAPLGDSVCMFDLALMLQAGDGGPVDLEGLNTWARKCADKRYPACLWMMGAISYNGWGAEKNLPEAARWFRLASERGDPQAMVLLGMMLDAGEGTAVNHAEATRWFRKGADKGEPTGYVYLAIRMMAGEVAPKDVPGALALLNKATDQGSGFAAVMLGDIYFDGVLPGVAKDLAVARKYYERGADLGEVRGMSVAGVMAMAGRGGPSDYAKGMAWLRGAAGKDDPDALYNLGVAYMNGEGAPHDETIARTYFRKAALLGSKEAKAALKTMGEVET